MELARHVVARKDQYLIPVPAPVRHHLGLFARGVVYWHVGTKGEAHVTVTERRVGGKPRSREACPVCPAKDQEIARLRARDWLRERTLFAEGYTAGVQAILLEAQPGGALLRARRVGRQAAALTLSDNPATTRRREQRERRVARGELRREGRPRRQTVEVPAPLLETPPAPAPSPSESSGGAAASGGEAPQAAH